jgi:hypothetical protein
MEPPAKKIKLIRYDGFKNILLPVSPIGKISFIWQSMKINNTGDKSPLLSKMIKGEYVKNIDSLDNVIILGTVLSSGFGGTVTKAQFIQKGSASDIVIKKFPIMTGHNFYTTKVSEGSINIKTQLYSNDLFASSLISYLREKRLFHFAPIKGVFLTEEPANGDDYVIKDYDLFANVISDYKEYFLAKRVIHSRGFLIEQLLTKMGFIQNYLGQRNGRYKDILFAISFQIIINFVILSDTKTVHGDMKCSNISFIDLSKDPIKIDSETLDDTKKLRYVVGYKNTDTERNIIDSYELPNIGGFVQIGDYGTMSAYGDFKYVNKAATPPSRFGENEKPHHVSTEYRSGFDTCTFIFMFVRFVCVQLYDVVGISESDKKDILDFSKLAISLILELASEIKGSSVTVPDKERLTSIIDMKELETFCVENRVFTINTIPIAPYSYISTREFFTRFFREYKILAKSNSVLVSKILVQTQ